MSRALGALLVLVGLLAGPLAPVARAVIVDRVAAVVNREVITLSQIYEVGGDYIEERAAGAPADSPVRRALELEVLDTLIQRELITQEMQRLGLDVTQDDMERAVDDIARQNGLSREQLRVEVERSGLSWNAYREELEESIRQMKFQQMILMPRVSVTEDELQDAYNRSFRLNYAGAEVRSLEGIFLTWPANPTPDDRAALALRSAELRAQLEAGTPWSELLAATTDSALFTLGGRLGSFQKGEAVAEIDGPAFSLQVGEVSQPIALPTGMLLLRVASAQSLPPPTYEQVQGQLYQELAQLKGEQELELWTTQARRAAAVVVRLELPEALAPAAAEPAVAP